MIIIFLPRIPISDRFLVEFICRFLAGIPLVRVEIKFRTNFGGIWMHLSLPTSLKSILKSSKL